MMVVSFATKILTNFTGSFESNAFEEHFVGVASFILRMKRKERFNHLNDLAL
jgi:hypothetical protein